jgi:fused signal recognition particle receptor
LLRGLFGKVVGLLRRGGRVDEALFLELEEALIEADVGGALVGELVDKLRATAKRERISETEALEARLREEIEGLFSSAPRVLAQGPTPPTVYLFVGVNGTGKTTTMAKVARGVMNQGQVPLLAAADTFRAAAIDQVKEWGKRLGVEVIAHQPGADPASVVFDAMQAAKARGRSPVLADTAGRLHTKKNLMNELNKIARVVQRELGRAADETLLVLDATTGQNAVRQAQEFNKAIGLTGIILAKMDSTAKGGAVLTVARDLGLPIKFMGTGERVEDLEEFEPKAFVAGLFE